MTDYATRASAREHMTVEEQAEHLLRRQRAGLIRDRGLELAAYCGHAAARMALGHGNETLAHPHWWHGLRRQFPEAVVVRAYEAAGARPDGFPVEFAWFARVSAHSSQIATDQAKAHLIRWAFAEP